MPRTVSTWGKVPASFHLICFFPLRAVDRFQGHVFTENIKYHLFTRAELTPDLGSDKYHLRCWIHGAGLLLLWFSALATLRTLPRNLSGSRSCSLWVWNISCCLPSLGSRAKLLVGAPSAAQFSFFFFVVCLFLMYYLHEKYCKSITIQCYVADGVSWVPRLTLLDL